MPENVIREEEDENNEVYMYVFFQLIIKGMKKISKMKRFKQIKLRLKNWKIPIFYKT